MNTDKQIYTNSFVPFHYGLPTSKDLSLDVSSLRTWSFEEYCSLVNPKLLYDNEYLWIRYFNFLILQSQFHYFDLYAVEQHNRYSFPSKVVTTVKHRLETGQFNYLYEIFDDKEVVEIGRDDDGNKLYEWRDIRDTKKVDRMVVLKPVGDPYEYVLKDANSLVDSHDTAFVGKPFVPVSSSFKFPDIDQGLIYYDGYDVQAYRIKDIDTTQDLFSYFKSTKYDCYPLLKDTLCLIKGSAVIASPSYVIRYYLDYDWTQDDVKVLKKFMHIVRSDPFPLTLLEKHVRSVTGIVSKYPGVKELDPVAPSVPIPDVKLEKDYKYDMREASTYNTEVASLYVRDSYELRVQAIRLVVSSLRLDASTKFLLYGDGAGTSYRAFHDRFDVVSFDPSLFMIEEARRLGNVVKMGSFEVLQDPKYADRICFISHVMNVDPRLLKYVLDRGKTILYETARFDGFSQFTEINDSLYITKDLSPSIFGTLLPVRKERPSMIYHDFGHALSNTYYIVGMDVSYPEFLYKAWTERGIKVKISTQYASITRRARGVYELAIKYGHEVVNISPNIVVTDQLVLGIRNLNVLKGYDTHKSLLITESCTFSHTFGSIMRNPHGKLGGFVFWEVSPNRVLMPIGHFIKNYHRNKIGDIVYLPPGKYQVSGKYQRVFEIG